MAKRSGVVKKKAGEMIIARLPTKLLKAVVAQAEAGGQSFSEYVIEVFTEATAGVQEVRG